VSLEDLIMSDGYEEIEWCLTVTAQQMINDHVLRLHGLSEALSKLADEAPPDLAIKLKALAAGAAAYRDDLDGLLEVL
jgi:hypothetical protein